MGQPQLPLQRHIRDNDTDERRSVRGRHVPQEAVPPYRPDARTRHARHSLFASHHSQRQAFARRAAGLYRHLQLHAHLSEAAAYALFGREQRGSFAPDVLLGRYPLRLAPREAGHGVSRTPLQRTYIALHRCCAGQYVDLLFQSLHQAAHRQQLHRLPQRDTGKRRRAPAGRRAYQLRRRHRLSLRLQQHLQLQPHLQAHARLHSPAIQGAVCKEAYNNLIFRFFS